MLHEKKQWDELEFIIFNTPKKLNLQKLFPNFSEVLLHKVYFIIHQCNYWHSEGKSYNLDIRNHHWFLSLSTNEVTAIKDVLVSNFIIKCTRHGSQGLSALYTIVEPYDIKDLDNVSQHWYYLKQPNCPLHVQRYVADKGAVRNRETTQWVKVPSTGKRKVKTPVQPLESLTNDKDAYIKLLEAALTANNISLPIMDSTPATPVKEIGVEPANLTGVYMAGGHIEPVLAPEPEVKPIDKAKDFLAKIKAGINKPVPQTPKIKTTSDTKAVEIGQGFGGYTIGNYSKLLKVITVLSEKDIFSLNRAMIRALKVDAAETKTIELRGRKLDFVINPVDRVVMFVVPESMEMTA